jgi:hypothetical protein
VTTNQSPEGLADKLRKADRDWYVPGESYPVISVAADAWIKEVRPLLAPAVSALRDHTGEGDALLADALSRVLAVIDESYRQYGIEWARADLSQFVHARAVLDAHLSRTPDREGDKK